MGAGSWSSVDYGTAQQQRQATNTPAFQHTTRATDVHPNLDPKRINKKPFKKLESRDSTEHPLSNPVFVSFDVTGSNYDRAVVAQKKLPTLMDLLQKYLTDPQVAVAANDDVKVQENGPIQISDFESDNRVDEHIRNVWLTQNGGGNGGESYDLILYAAARKTVLDSVEKRGKKGYLFLYADEPFYPLVDKNEVHEVFGDRIEKNIPIEEIIEEARKNFVIFVMWPSNGGYSNAKSQYKTLFGEEYVISLEHPNLLCEVIAGTIGLYEDKATATSVVKDLVAVGVSAHEAKLVGTALAKIDKNPDGLVSSGKKAKRL